MRTSLIALAATLVTAPPAMAQSAEQSTGWTPGEIVVTAHKDDGYSAQDAATLRTPVSLLETPQSVQVLTRTLIDEQDLTTLADAVRNISGVVPALPSEAVLVNPIVRGFESEVYLDGLPLYGDTAASDPSSLVSVERIEVAKGPTSQLFGGGTGAPVGGLINVVSASPQADASYRASFRTGSFSTLQPSVDINQPIGRNVAIRIAGEYLDAKDAIDAVTNERLTLAPALRIGFDDTSLIVRANYSRIKQLEYSGIPFAMAGAPGVDPYHFSGAKDAPKTEIENLTLTGVFTHRLSENVTAKLQVRNYHSRLDEYGSFPYLAFYPPMGTVYPIITGYLPVKVDEWSFDGSLTATFATGGIEHVLIAGAQYDMVDYDGAMGFNFFPVGLLDYSDRNSNVPFGPTSFATDKFVNAYRTLGFYAQDQMTIGDRIHVLAGLRYSRMEITESLNGFSSPKHSFNRVDPRVGVTIDVVDGVSLFAGYATGSRLSVFFNPLAIPTTPETSESWEGGLKFGLKDIGLSGTIAAFHQNRNNVPLTDPFFVTRQVGQQRAQGVEADLIWEPSKSFSLLASYAYTDAKVTRDQFTPANVGEHLSRVPEHSGRIAVRYRFTEGALNGLGLGLGMTAASGSHVTLPNSVKTKGYAVFDAQASYETGPFRIGVSVSNIFDRTYFTPYQYLGQPVVRPGTPRAAFVTLGVSY
ncbi:TonB-dependent receptor [Sphingopyxis granuli]|uniref:TonB-dependent siderophore receptor n=1 Tax=Sphingopyxis granuli TaxID=267128 RepID=UPI001F532722|nr:TonB-dependent receptor [Sphingopyxis granuli]UNK80046.1 TonB-dependent receptor [Sphingopyxis granuli]